MNKEQAQKDFRIMIGKRLKMLRKTVLNLSEEQFSEKIGISRYRLMRIEKGQVPVNVDELFCISEFFDISVMWLLEGIKTGKGH